MSFCAVLFSHEMFWVRSLAKLSQFLGGGVLPILTLCHLISSYIFKTTPSGAKVKMTFGIGRDVSKQTLTLTRTRRHFPDLLSCISYENLHYYFLNLFLKVMVQRLTYLIIVYAIYTAKPTHYFTQFSRQDGCRTFLLSKLK